MYVQYLYVSMSAYVFQIFYTPLSNFYTNELIVTKLYRPYIYICMWGREILRFSIFIFTWNVGENESIINVTVEVK